MAKKKSKPAPKKKEALKIKEQRKLAVIMFTDMVGYSALTQKDEALALRLLEEHRHLLRPIFPKHGGKEIKTIGDAFLVEFSSALDASACAVAMQKTLFARNQESPNQIQIRIGLHVGDVVYKQRDVYGDGVNIASRIEPLAEPGGICVSEDLARQIANKIEYPLVKLGKGELKNIDMPVEIYRLMLPWNRRRSGVLDRLKFAYSQKRIRRATLAGLLFTVLALIILWRTSPMDSGSPPANRVAVLPFLNIGNDLHEEYFSDGMTEELISGLSKVRGLNVIARTSIAKYKGLKTNITDIGRELNVGTVLEGSVQMVSDRARIRVHLIEVQSQQQIWSQEYDREIKDVFAIQSDIAMSVTNALRVQLLSVEREQLQKRTTENNEAYRLYLLGRFHLNKRTGDEVMKSIDYFTQATQADSKFALAYAGLAEAYTLAGNAGYGSLPREQTIQNAKTYAAKALEMDESQAEAHASLAYVKFRIDWDWKGAEVEFKRALELKPGYARAHEWYALYLAIMKRLDESMVEMKKAQVLDPLSTSVSNGIGRIYHFAQKYDLAVEQFRRTIEMDPVYAEAYFSVGMTHVMMRRFDEAIPELKKAIGLSGNRLVMLSMLGLAYGIQGRVDETKKIFDEFTKLSHESYVSPYYFAILSVGLGNKDQAMDYLDKAYEERDGILIFLRIEPVASSVWPHPRFVALMKKMGFP